MPALLRKNVYGRASSPPAGMDERSHRGIPGDYEKLGMLYLVGPPQGRIFVDDYAAQAGSKCPRPVDRLGDGGWNDRQADEYGTADILRVRTAKSAVNACHSVGKDSGCLRTVDGERRGKGLGAEAHQIQASVLLTQECGSIRQVSNPLCQPPPQCGAEELLMVGVEQQLP